MSHCRHLDQNYAHRHFSFPLLTGGRSLTCLMSEGLALRSKKRLMGKLISSGFYMRNLSWLQTLSGSQAN